MVDNRGSAMLLLRQFAGQSNIFTIHRVFIDFTGSLEAALLLNQMLYWSDKSKRRDGYFYKSYVEWTKETSLSEYATRKAIRGFKLRGFVTTKVQKASGSPTLHCKLHVERVLDALMQFLQDRSPAQKTIKSRKTPANSVSAKSQFPSCEIEVSIPRNQSNQVHENTTENTTEEREGALSADAEFFMVEDLKSPKGETTLADQTPVAPTGKIIPETKDDEKQVPSAAPTSETYSLKDHQLWRLWKRELPKPIAINARHRAAYCYLLLCPPELIKKVSNAELDEITSLGIVDKEGLDLLREVLRLFVAAGERYSNIGHIRDCHRHPWKLDKVRAKVPVVIQPAYGSHAAMGL